jgi:valyl-tRNA synthetase
MDGLEFTGQIPFDTVYLHGLIRIEDGRKMSKSKGTGIDPLPVMEEFGTDALRFTLLVGSTPGNDTKMSLKKVEGNRNFANKIWNAGRFVISAIASLPDDGQQTIDDPAEKLGTGGLSSAVNGQALWTLADSWIWARLQALVREVERLFQSYQYGEAGRQIYEYVWNDFADWYVEVAKLQMQRSESKEQTVVTLVRVLDMCLRLLHPITPFVTEELWGNLRKAILVSPLKELAADWPEALIVAAWPEARPEEGWETERLADFGLLQEIVRSIRNLRAEKKVSPAKRLPATLVCGSKAALIREQSSLIAVLAGLDVSVLSVLESLDARPENSIALIAGVVEIYVPLSGMLDLEAEHMRLQKELADVQVQIERLEKLLGSDFANKAPAVVVQKERKRLAAFQETAGKLKAQLD